MAYKPVEAIEVRAWDRTVGATALDPRLGYYAFEYDPEWVRRGIELAPLTMPLVQAQEPFVFLDLPEQTYRRLPALLADSLPDDFGNALVDAWMAQHGVRKNAITALDRLAYMGRRGMGALELHPQRGPIRQNSSAIEMSDLVESARLAVRGGTASDRETQAALAQIIQVGTSAGGARAKAVIAWNPVSGEIRSGQFDAPEGFEHWLIKLDGVPVAKGVTTTLELSAGSDWGRVEYAYHLMARAAGISMMDCRVLEENGRAHFMTRRFDREGGRKIHAQTLCAMAHLDYRQKATHDVSQLFQALERLRLDYAAREEAFRRVVFNVLAANCDDHSKNTSFLLREGGSWELSPAYDVTFAFNPKSEWVFQHLMSVNGKFAEIGRNDLLVLAEQFGIGTANEVLDSVAETIGNWPEYAGKAGLTAERAKEIAKEHRTGM